MGKTRGAWVVATAVAVAGIATGMPSRASEPSAGTVDRDHPAITWTGSTIAQQGGVGTETGCVIAVPDPTCDTFALTIGDLSPVPPADGETPTPPADDVRIAIAPDDAPLAGLAEFDLYVYDADGNEIARSTELGSADAITLFEPAAGVYTVAVQDVLSEPGATYAARADVLAAEPVPAADPENPCGLEGAPGGQVTDPVGAAAVIGDPTAALEPESDEVISLDVLVLLDGIAQADAEAIYAKAARSYEPLGITLHAAEYRAVDVVQPDNDASAMIAKAKALVGGKRPAGIDIVELLTDQDIQQLGQAAVAGLADCIGGVAHPDRAFLVAEGNTPENLAFGPVVFDYEARTNVTAHEIGHLMGGQHHYANCVEGIQAEDVHDDGTVEVSPCTLMFNAADFLGYNFDTLNGRIVRGSAIRYAR
ncbi:MAG: hypothetical protein QOH68_3558 [Nocardioidaceae bacterium]|nr:hypothetical protein [Nocardioidaceae bacterium]